MGTLLDPILSVCASERLLPSFLRKHHPCPGSLPLYPPGRTMWVNTARRAHWDFFYTIAVITVLSPSPPLPFSPSPTGTSG